MASVDGLLGTWTTVTWRRQIVATGEMIDALGPDPVGYINYGADGRIYARTPGRVVNPPITDARR